MCKSLLLFLSLIGCELKDKELPGYAGGKRVTYKTLIEATEACKRGNKFS